MFADVDVTQSPRHPQTDKSRRRIGVIRLGWIT
jgi:hypothetical protein